MGTLRSGDVPIEHMVAELVAAPFAHPSVETDLSGTGSLWRTCENRLLTTLPSLSVDELVAMRDRLWFADLHTGKPLTSPVSMTTYLRRLASASLRSDGFCVRVRSWSPWQDPARSSDLQARGQARWLFLALPEDLLLAALPGSGHPHLELLSEGLSRVLQKHRYAVIHQHSGASLSFSDLWARAMQRVSFHTIQPTVFESPSAELDEGRGLGALLLATCVGRLVIGKFLRDRQKTPGLRFGTFYESLLLEERRWQGLRSAWLLNRTLRALANGTTGECSRDWIALQLLVRELPWGHWCPAVPASNEPLSVDDPLKGLFPEGCSPELSWTRQGLEVLEQCEQGRTREPFLEQLFWQCIRARVLFYRHIVQRPMVPGLAWFMRQFARIGPGRGELEVLPGARALEGPHGLAALEVRTSPEATLNPYLSLVRGTRRVADTPAFQDLKLGWALHFSRDRGGNFRKGTPHPRSLVAHVSFEEDPQVHGMRFASHYRQLRDRAVVWGEFLTLFPASLGVFRAVDACSDEQGVPTWVIAPLFRYVQQVSLRCSEALWERRSIRLPPLRCCPHAGEDFVHLASGLRRLDEALQYLGMQEGDRLGHALALGIEPRRWAEGLGRLSMSLDNRFMDLAWERALWHRLQELPPGGRGIYLAEEVDRLSRELFGFPCAWVEVDAFLKLLYNEHALRDAGFPDGLEGPHPPEAHTARHLLRLYLRDSRVYRRGQQILVVDPRVDVDALISVQTQLRTALRDRRITIEVNATGNLLIGNYRTLEQHPVWRVAPYQGDAADASDVLSGLSADNPLTFNTSVSREYQLVEDTLCGLGATQAERSRWLQRSMETSVVSSFVLAQKECPEPETLLIRILEPKLPP